MGMNDKPGVTVTVSALEAGDFDHWHGLWRGYLTFYGHTVSDAVTARTWSRLLDPAVPMFGWATRSTPEAPIQGFVHCVEHLNTWMEQPICYLEDLFVDPVLRGKGAGRALIQHVIDHGHQVGWGRIYWNTQTHNETARALYDKMARLTDFVKYQVDVETHRS